jgi:hypothetical protein
VTMSAMGQSYADAVGGKKHKCGSNFTGLGS